MHVNSMFVFLLLIAIGIFVKETDGANPGFRLALTTKGIEYILHIGIPILEKQPFPIDKTFTGSKGGLDYIIHNIHFQNLKIPNAYVKSGTTGIFIHLTDVSINGNVDWHYRRHAWPHIQGTGTEDISATGITIDLNAILIDNTDQGKFSLLVLNCTATIGHVHINDHGKGHWLYDHILVGTDFDVEGNICFSMVTTGIDNGINKVLATLPMIENVTHIAKVDYSFVQSPTYGLDYIETYHKGEFYYIEKPSEAPFSPSPLPPLTTINSDSMLYIWLNEYFFNTAAYVYQESGLLTYTATPDKVPSNFRRLLNTSVYKFVLKNLYKDYPNMPMQLDLVSTKPPVLQINPDSVNLTIVGTMEADVIKPDKTIVNAFVIGVTLNVIIDVGLYKNGTKEMINGSITNYKYDMVLLSTSIGQFPVLLYENTINFFIKKFILPPVNYYISKGAAIPTVDGITFGDPQLTLGKGYIMINTDFSYKPQDY